MEFGPEKVWLVPLLPLLSAAILAFVRVNRGIANLCAVGSMGVSCLLSGAAFFSTSYGQNIHPNWNFTWLEVGTTPVQLGFVLDPLTACMLLMVTFIGLLIFIYSMGYMADDPRYTRFFCYMSLFAGGMLGVVIANSLLLLFICWEIVGVASYLLIGFWYAKPSAAAAAKKAFITTRIGDLGLFVAMLWLFSASGTLLFHDSGSGLLDQNALGEEVINPILSQLASTVTPLGVTAATAIALLIFWGGDGQVRAGAVACVAAGRDGRAHPGECADSCGDDGGGGCLPRGEGVSNHGRGCRCMAREQHGLNGGHLGGSSNGTFRRVDCGGAKRHQADSGLFHGFAARLHDDGTGNGWRVRRDVPSAHARIF